MPVSSRRGRVIAIAIAAIAVTAAMLGGAAFTRLQDQRDWEQLRAVAEEVQQRLAQRTHQREPAWGEGRPGSAFAHYEVALGLVQEACRSDAKRQQAMLMMSGDAIVADAAATVHLARCEAAFDELRAGAHCTDVTPRSWPQSREATNLLRARDLMNAAMFTTRVALHRGESLAAVQRTLDAATFALDLYRPGTLIDRIVASGVLGIAVSECWPDAALQRLDAPALALLAEGLARIDRQLPHEIDADAEFVFSAQHLQLAASADGATRESQWLRDAGGRGEVARLLLQQHERMRGPMPASWPQREAMLERVAAAESPTSGQAAALLCAELATRQVTAAALAAARGRSAARQRTAAAGRSTRRWRAAGQHAAGWRVAAAQRRRSGGTATAAAHCRPVSSSRRAGRIGDSR